MLLAIWTALLAIGGTWLGQRWANAAAFQRIKEEQEFQDDRRFHLLRTERYASYLAASSRFSGACFAGGQPSLDDRQQFLATFEELRMVATTDVAVQATALHVWIIRLSRKTPSTCEFNGYTRISAQLVISMREELGLVEEGESEGMLTALLALSSDEEGDTARNDEAPNGG